MSKFDFWSGNRDIDGIDGIDGIDVIDAIETIDAIEMEAVISSSSTFLSQL